MVNVVVNKKQLGTKHSASLHCLSQEYWSALHASQLLNSPELK